MKKKYTIGTWDSNKGAFTPQRGVGQCVNVSWQQMLRVLRRLKAIGYEVTKSGGCSVHVVNTTGLSRDEACRKVRND